MLTRIRAYVGSLVLAAILAAFWVYSLDPSLTDIEARAAASFAALTCLSGLLAYKRSDGRDSGSIAFLPMLASVIVAPHWITIALVGLASCVVEVISRRVPLKATFNSAQAVFWVSASILAYTYLGGAGLLVPGAQIRYGAFVASVAVFAILNSSSVAAAIAISDHQQFVKVLWTRARVTVVYDLFALPFVYLFALCYVNWGILAAIGLIIPLWGARELYKVNSQLKITNQELLQLMVAAIEARDPYTSGHSRRVSRNARLIAQAIGLREKQVERIAVAALLHDVGKIHEVFAPILSKPGRLTAEENAIMQTHPIKSEALVKTVSQLSDVVAPIRFHHENWDGTGYPDGLVGEQIPLASRIIMFADTIDAMTTDRPYRAALTEPQVRAEFVKLRGRQFDPNICDQLLASSVYGRLFDQDVSLAPVIADLERRKAVASAPLLAS